MLATFNPNVGNDRELYAKCPNCTRGHQIVNAQGQQLGTPPRCLRCGCPMQGTDARHLQWMNDRAAEDHSPALKAAYLANQAAAPALEDDEADE